MKEQPLIIGMAGGTASGKSTICSLIESSLNGFNVKAVHTDDYFKQNKPSITAPFTGVVYEDHNHPDSIDFEKLLKDINQFRKEDFDIILIEGILVLYKDEIRECLDLKIFVDCQSDERMARRIKRNMEWGLSFDEITSVYLDAVRYRHNEFVEPSRWHADLILNGSTFSDKGIKLVIEWIKSSIRTPSSCTV